jgi:hypothetical protein
VKLLPRDLTLPVSHEKTARLNQKTPVSVDAASNVPQDLFVEIIESTDVFSLDVPINIKCRQACQKQPNREKNPGGHLEAMIPTLIDIPLPLGPKGAFHSFHKILY